MKLLPCQDEWCQEVAASLIDGQNHILRGLPATGKSTLVDAIAEILGPSALVVRGRSYSESDSEAAVNGIRANLLALVSEHGCAQLLFDDYPHALRRSYGAQIQRMLLHILVDGPHARDIGALLTGRWARSMHLRVRGSPLVARSTQLSLPESTNDDLRAVGVAEDELLSMEKQVGSNCALAARLRRIGGRIDLANAREFAEQWATSWMDDLPVDALQWLQRLARGMEVGALDGHGWEAVQPLIVDDGGSLCLAETVASATFLHNLQGRSVLWPAERSASVHAFVSLLSGVDDVIWVDRYLLKNPCELLDFIKSVRQSTTSRLRLLFASSAVIGELRQSIDCVLALARLPNCELRAVSAQFYQQLHDRHLAFLGDREDGAVVPTADVILGRVPVGTAMAVHVPVFDRQLHLDAWESAIPLDRLPLIPN